MWQSLGHVIFLHIPGFLRSHAGEPTALQKVKSYLMLVSLSIITNILCLFSIAFVSYNSMNPFVEILWLKQIVLKFFVAIYFTSLYMWTYIVSKTIQWDPLKKDLNKKFKSCILHLIGDSKIRYLQNIFTCPYHSHNLQKLFDHIETNEFYPMIPSTKVDLLL